MTEVKETDREAVKADLLSHLPQESVAAQRVVEIRNEIDTRKRVAGRLQRRDEVTTHALEMRDIEGKVEMYDFRTAREVRFNLKVKGKDGSIVEEPRVAFVTEMQGNKPVWATDKDGKPLSFSAPLFDASPVSGAVVQGIDTVTRSYPKLEPNGSIKSVTRITMPRSPIGK